MLALLLLAQSASMAMPAVDCSRIRVALPQALSGWSRTVASPTIGRAFTLAAKTPATPEKRPGGVAAADFRVATKGTYSIAIDQGAWIDLRTTGTLLKSVAHRHGPACSGIRKVVDFALSPGDYALAISGLDTSAVKVLIAPAG